MYTARLTKQLFWDHNVDMMKIAARYLDFNPIKILWYITGRRFDANCRKLIEINCDRFKTTVIDQLLLRFLEIQCSLTDYWPLID